MTQLAWSGLSSCCRPVFVYWGLTSPKLYKISLYYQAKSKPSDGFMSALACRAHARPDLDGHHDNWHCGVTAFGMSPVLLSQLIFN